MKILTTAQFGSFFVVLILSLSGTPPAVGAVWPKDGTHEDGYWKKVHEQEAQKQQAEEERQSREREAARADVARLVRAGSAIQPQLIAAQDSLRRPSFFEGKMGYFFLGTYFALISGLTIGIVLRQKREAEIRALSGGYLSDGVEAARFQMPALFQFPSLHQDRDGSSDPSNANAHEPSVVFENPALEFFAQAPEWFVQMRSLLVELERTTDEAARRGVLLQLHVLVCALKSKADRWDLHPVWQLASALELLVKRVADEAKDATASTLRTVAHAVDLLCEISGPGVRPDLIIHPPISVLAVDDDSLCLRAVVFALQKAGITPDIAADGEKAVVLAGEKAYDVIFMDIQMPGIDGLTAASKIREVERNKTTPVVFVTVQSDFRTSAKSSLMGGTDLMAKPFLMFEITVKALTLAMRNRLQPATSCEREVSGLAKPVPAVPHTVVTVLAP